MGTLRLSGFDGIWFMRYVAVRIASPIKLRNFLENINALPTSRKCIFSLSHSILLRDVYARGEVYNPILHQVRTQGRIEIVFCVVYPKNLNLAMELGLDHIMEGFEGLVSSIFIFQEIYPCCSAKMINESNEPFKTIISVYS